MQCRVSSLIFAEYLINKYQKHIYIYILPKSGRPSNTIVSCIKQIKKKRVFEEINKPEIVSEARDEVIRRSEATENMETAIIFMFNFTRSL